MLIASSFFSALLDVAAESAPYLFLGITAAALLRAFVPEQRVYELLGRDSFRSVFLASAIGVPLPLCSCSVIPAATALRQCGASRGATISFLISTPETGVDSIGITYALMDPIMTLIRPVAAFVTALVTGTAVGLLPASTDASPPREPVADDGCCSSEGCGADTAGPPTGWRESVLNGFRYAFGPLLEDLAPWLMVGFVLAALLAVAIPDGILANIPSGWISSLLMMVIAAPLYVCAAAATPIAAALVLKGLDPGAALVFLLVGPATNITTILVVSRFMGNRVLGIYLGGVTTCALLFGVAVNIIYSGLGIDASAVMATAGDSRITPVQAVSVIALMALLGYHLSRRLWPRPQAGDESSVSSVLR
ncbi:MAG: SO_0444 family Cu/Zn efflux transporter [Acidobacteria bacterium]|nr:SO_0444 family Cu/Zn efflux transporter [Acidobacteriota bacterium]